MPFLKTKTVVFETTVAVEGQHYRTKHGFSTFPDDTVLRKTTIQEKQYLPALDFFDPIPEKDLETYFESATEAEFKAFEETQAPELEPWATPEIQKILEIANQPHTVTIADKDIADGE